MRTADLTHRRWGWTIDIVDVPLWAYACSRGTDALMGWLGHPCCGRKIGRIPPVAATARWLLRRAVNAEARFGHLRLSSPASHQSIVAAFPELADWEDDPDWRDGVLWQADCPICHQDFASGAGVNRDALDDLRRHLESGECHPLLPEKAGRRGFRPFA